MCSRRLILKSIIADKGTQDILIDTVEIKYLDKNESEPFIYHK